MAGKFFLVLVSAMLAILLSEMTARLLLDPVDYLVPQLVLDERYVHRIASGSGGHDAFGFRNVAIPETVEILVVGDSQTYGHSAKASESWPVWFAQLSGRTVYTAAVGAYGPVEYVRLITELAPRFRPSTILIGFYIGNDIWDAGVRCPNFRPKMRIADCRTDVAKLFREQFEEAANENFLGGVRDWLSQHSVLYQAAKLNFSHQLGQIRKLEARGQGIIKGSVGGTEVAFQHGPLFAGMDLNREVVTLGMKVTIESFGQINEYCITKNIFCVFLVIPTKMSVFYDYVFDSLESVEKMLFKGIYDFERQRRTEVERFFDSRGIDYIDLLPFMAKAVKSLDPLIYPQWEDDHPNERGYRVIASAVLEQLKIQYPRP